MVAMKRVVFLAVAVFALVQGVRADEAETPQIERIPCNSYDKKINILVPKAWALVEQKPKQDHCELFAVGAIEVDGKRESMEVRIYLLKTANSAVHQAQIERAMALQQGMRTELVLEPIPTLERHNMNIVDYNLYRLVKGQCISLMLSVPEKAIPMIREEAVSMLKSIRSDHPHYPKLPPGFKSSPRDGVTWHIQEGVPKKQLRELYKSAKELRKRFAKIHGKQRKPHTDQAPQIVVIHDPTTANALHAGMKLEDGLGAVPHTSWLVVRPSESLFMPRFAFFFTDALFRERYGTSYPYWASFAEKSLAWNEVQCEARLPMAPQHFIDDTAVVPMTVRKLMEDELKVGRPPDVNYMHAKLWVAYFHAGPSKFRKAYLKFLDDFSKTGDVGTSFNKHLGDFDEEKLKKQVVKWRDKKLTPCD